MINRSVFASLNKHAWKLIPLSLLLLLSGCGSVTEPIDAQTTGWFNHYFIYSFSRLITFLAGLFNGNYGLSIILVTLLVRGALLPLMLRQYRAQANMRAKMMELQPELQALKDKYKDAVKGSEAQKNMQTEMMQLYQKHQINPLGMGCLPLLIQLPFLYAFYYAIRRTPEIASHSFLWFNLGHPDHILPIAAAIIYFVQFKISQQGSTPEQQKQMAFIGLLSPIMMGLFSFTAPAALPLYWTVGGCFLIFQSWLAKRLYPAPQVQHTQQKS
ncbi:membrane protein insertase YidC [Paenibacillus abyssi]|uniref:Membrane protein insertase YidC n=1 Tax=Paenibacillus abyssi TaxID=1340531 RepID=A0A917D249_9BACL|nr:membrane protein insertase YidC [Paenibacillus abyssi]GGG03816.1 membrane protein insertase YidC 1 [Paenibacillus abyssi]